MNRLLRRMAGRMPNRNGINAAGNGDESVKVPKRTSMMRPCTGPFYAVVVWRGRPGAELCGVFLDHREDFADRVDLQV